MDTSLSRGGGCLSDPKTSDERDTCGDVKAPLRNPHNLLETFPGGLKAQDSRSCSLASSSATFSCTGRDFWVRAGTFILCGGLEAESAKLLRFLLDSEE